MKKRVNSLQIALQASAETGAIALCSAQPMGEGEAAPEWVHLLPAGEIRTGDGRGPYRFANAAALIRASLQAAGSKLVIDENHATDLAAPKGLPAPAMGWVVALEARQDGIWGKVDWTDAGAALVAGKAYRGISPVITHDATGNIAAILRASLVNVPNFKTLTTLHAETPTMDLMAKLLAALSLPTGTSEETLLTAITTMHAAQTSAKATNDAALQTALQAQAAPLATALGLAADAKPDQLLAAVTQLKAGATDETQTIVSLQAELVNVGNQLKALQDDTLKGKAETFVDGAIAAKRVGVSAQRDRFISMHMADPAGTEALINGLPALGPSNTLATPPLKTEGMAVSLNAEQQTVAKALGIPFADYAAQLAVEQGSAV
jgi:phage I-like protein